MHVRLRNALILRLAKRALAIASAEANRESDPFQAFCNAFREELIRFEDDLLHMESRLRGGTTGSGNDH